ncbi:MAG: TRAP transporter small permease subunit [Desulfobacterium sp.]|nr:TRAP transporter small permease subunit [Desulfobacterium sp.]
MEKEKQGLRFDYLVAAILLFSMAFIAFANVVSRYFFHFSIASTEEITINMFVWMTVVGCGVAFERGGQLGVVTFYNLFPRKLKKTVVVASALLSAVLFVLVDFFMIQAIYDELTIFHATSASLSIPVWIYYAGVPFLSLFVFRGIYRDAVKRLKIEEEAH